MILTGRNRIRAEKPLQFTDPILTDPKSNREFHGDRPANNCPRQSTDRTVTAGSYAYENCDILGYYAPIIGNFLLTFRDNL